MVMKSQLEFLQEAIQLIKENPQCKVLFFVSNSELCEDEDMYTAHEISVIEKDYLYDNGFNLIVGIDNIIDEIEDSTETDITEEEAIRKSKEVILIYTKAARLDI